MLYYIVINEIMDHLKSLRLMLTFVLLVVLMVVSAILFISDYHQQIEDYTQHQNEALAQLSDRASRTAALFYIYSFNFDGPWIYKTPNYLSFISEGHGRNLPNAFQPSAFRIYGPSKRIRSNILLWRSDALDWALIIGIVLSFISLILVYDRISGERESGTLRLCLSNCISRSTVILGKFLGGFACLSVSLLLGMVVHLIILSIFGNIPFVTIDWIVIGLTFILSLLYISVFLMLGLFISSRTRESATSLVVALLFWAIFVIVVPRTGGLIASQVTDIPALYDASSDASRAEQDAKKNYDERNPESARASSSGHWSPGEPLERAIEMSDAWSGVFDDYRNQMIHQVELAQKITLISPFACFTNCLEKLIESGTVHYKKFSSQVRNYKLTMRQSLLDNYPVPVKWNSWNRNLYPGVSEADFQKMLQKIDFESIPKFQEKRTALGTVVNEALPYFLLLVLFNLLFFSGAFVSFIRYDVR